MTKPAFSISDRRNVQQSRTNNQHSRGETESDFLTPTKRKLIQNNNTGTLRMIFEADTSSLPRVGVVVGGGTEVASPAKKRRCEPTLGVKRTHIQLHGD